MSKDRGIDLLTPVGRFVGGSFYRPQNNPTNIKLWKNGPDAGKPRPEFWFAIAIRKNGEQHWSQIQPVIGANGKANGTDWAQIIWTTAHAAMPTNSPSQNPGFAWKIIDGDSTVLNSAQKRPCDYEGYAGHWILNFTSSFAPSIVSADGTKQLTELDFVNVGDFVQVFGSVVVNASGAKQSIFLNHKVVAFAAYGERIKYTGISPEEIGFGGAALPPGASAIPLTQGFSPAVAPPAVAPVVPHVGILTPPPPPPAVAIQAPSIAPNRIMLPLAGGVAYEDYIKSGWTDALLVQLGYMAP